ncbi:Uu.00g130320.m01.CDS01 [Anthostomella pinea]|uniref:Uu.00g130320.m01.CDS01 n=1 Tax=Anthostomella pinea TaxID=933095 RepID=A0AAI8YFR5_9PEZI|nr:Uu.00g130320.m01.CDS01 [Anthostomella pinea]
MALSKRIRDRGGDHTKLIEIPSWKVRTYAEHTRSYEIRVAVQGHPLNNKYYALCPDIGHLFHASYPTWSIPVPKDDADRLAHWASFSIPKDVFLVWAEKHSMPDKTSWKDIRVETSTHLILDANDLERYKIVTAEKLKELVSLFFAKRVERHTRKKSRRHQYKARQLLLTVMMERKSHAALGTRYPAKLRIDNCLIFQDDPFGRPLAANRFRGIRFGPGRGVKPLGTSGRA